MLAPLAFKDEANVKIYPKRERNKDCPKRAFIKRHSPEFGPFFSIYFDPFI